MGNPSSSQPPHASDATPVDDPAAHPWRRYVAIGDSFSEGIGDPDPDRPGYHRGWADRLAEELSRLTPPGEALAYANPVSYTHLTLPTTLHECRSRWSPYH